ncbi:MAG: HAD family phosphatase [Fimbriimonadaceae bacterium]|nr:HAD family phosphatase [Fimbriimonadaceae bacterium]
MARVRLIATDLDGTLLTSRREVHHASAYALRTAHEAGIVVCLASGRALNTMLPYAEQLGIPGPIVSCNGAYVIDQDGGVVRDHTLDQATRDTLLAYAEEHGLHVNAYVKGRVLASESGAWFELYRSRVRSELEVVGMAGLASYVPTKLLYISDPDDIQAHRARLLPLMAQSGVTVVVSEPDYIEFLPVGVTKGGGLKSVADSLGIDRSEVAAVGDWDNDLEMVQWAGFGGAVANGSDAMRQAADVVVATNDMGGVAEFLELALRRSEVEGGYTHPVEV